MKKHLCSKQPRFVAVSLASAALMAACGCGPAPRPAPPRPIMQCSVQPGGELPTAALVQAGPSAAADSLLGPQAGLSRALLERSEEPFSPVVWPRSANPGVSASSGPAPGSMRVPRRAVISRSEQPIQPHLEPEGLARAVDFASASGSTLSVEVWMQRMFGVMAQVGTIRVNGKPGTAFLVGPDLVLTNYHVVNKVIEDKVSPDRVQVEFKGLPGSPLDCNVVLGLAREDWLVAHSPDSQADDLPDPKPFEATAEELDYALLRLDGAPGRDRGYIPLMARIPAVSPGDPLLIVHRQQEELLVSPQLDGVVGLNAQQTRLRYLNYSLGGTSGAPVFNKDWQLVALHHASDPRQEPEYNEGIPIATILAHMPEAAREELGL